MKILFSLLLLISFAHAGCRFNDEVKAVWSLSGPMSTILEELDLLKSPAVKGLTIFYPSPRGFKGEIVPGGVFLSPAKLQEMKNGIIFYDSSQELEKVLKAHGLQGTAVVSRNMTPHEVTVSLLQKVRPFVRDCDVAAHALEKKLKEKESSIRKMMPKKMKVVFFLGEFHTSKLPELVIANDGLVKWLRQENLISGYPSDLAYVNWSAAVLHDLKDYTYVGLKEAKDPKVSGEGRKMTLAFPGALNPGLRQLEAWNFFLEQNGKTK
jgi:hypothetical protein